MLNHVFHWHKASQTGGVETKQGHSVDDVFISIVVVVRVTQLGLTFSMKAMIPSNMGQEDVGS